jgi:hypothetical protein
VIDELVDAGRGAGLYQNADYQLVYAWAARTDPGEYERVAADVGRLWKNLTTPKNTETLSALKPASNDYSFVTVV